MRISAASLKRWVEGERTGDGNPRKWVVFDLAFVILVIAVLVAIVFIARFARENAQLKRTVARTNGSLAGPQSARAGDVVPGFRTVDLMERPVEITYDGSARFLIFVFSSGCGSCASELPVWNNISTEALARGYAVRGITLDSLEQSRSGLADKNVEFDVVLMPDAAIRRAYRVVSIPEVLLVSGTGRIDWVYNGAMSSETVADLLTRIRAGS